MAGLKEAAASQAIKQLLALLSRASDKNIERLLQLLERIAPDEQGKTDGEFDPAAVGGEQSLRSTHQKTSP